MDGVFLYGNYARDLMIQNGFNPSKLHVIYNSLNYDEQLVIRKELTRSDIYSNYFRNTNPVIIFIGRLTKIKDLPLLIEAVSKLRDEGKFYNVVLVGDGEDRDFLRQDVEKRGLSNQVWFYGASYDERKNAELIFNADLCVAPGNIGLTAMHAMMFGCPCMSHDDFAYQMPEFEAIKPGVTGDFFKRNDPSSIASAIDKWFLENGSRRESIRSECYQEIDSKWNSHNQINILKQVLKSDCHESSAD
jgi:glycosyltransferase involved in cell wall biosynthesis